MSDHGFVSLKALKGEAPRSPAEIIAEIRRIYFKTSKATIQHDLAHAIELLKSLPDEDTRDRAAVYMEGLAQMRKEWMTGRSKGKGQRAKVAGKGRKAKVAGEGRKAKVAGEGRRAKVADEG